MRDVKDLGNFSISVGIFKITVNVCNSTHCSHDRTHNPEWNSLFQILGKSISLSKCKMPSKLRKLDAFQAIIAKKTGFLILSGDLIRKERPFCCQTPANTEL